MNTPRRAIDYEEAEPWIKTNICNKSEIIQLTRREPQKPVKYLTSLYFIWLFD